MGVHLGFILAYDSSDILNTGNQEDVSGFDTTHDSTV